MQREVVSGIQRFQGQISETKGRKQYDKVTIEKLYSERSAI